MANVKAFEGDQFCDVVQPLKFIVGDIQIGQTSALPERVVQGM